MSLNLSKTVSIVLIRALEPKISFSEDWSDLDTKNVHRKVIFKKKIGWFFEKYFTYDIGFLSDEYMIYGPFTPHISTGIPLFLPFQIYVFLPPYEFSKPKKNHVLPKIHLIT